MSKYEIKEVNCETGEEVIREMTPEEIAIRKADEANAKARQDEENAAIAARLVLLERLGITQEEAALLLG
jgi:hypothetical protein